MNLQKALYTVLMSVLSVTLSVLTVFLAPVPLLLLRRNFGRWEMVSASVLGALSLAAFAPSMLVGYVGAVIVTFFLSECENANMSYTLSVLITVIAVTGSALLFASYASKVHGINFEKVFSDQIDFFVTQTKIPAEKADKEAVIRQVPSVLVGVILFFVWLNSVLVRRIERIAMWIPTKQKHFFPRSEFYTWHLPIEFVWVALIAAGGRILPVQSVLLKGIAENVSNIAILLYFFQGLAVVVSFLSAKKVSAFWRSLVYILIFTQLFLGVAFLGFIDLWMDFRNKTNSKKSPVI